MIELSFLISTASSLVILFLKSCTQTNFCNQGMTHMVERHHLCESSLMRNLVMRGLDLEVFKISGYSSAKRSFRVS